MPKVTKERRVLSPKSVGRKRELPGLVTSERIEFCLNCRNPKFILGRGESYFVGCRFHCWRRRLATLAECFLEECRRVADSAASRAAREGLMFLRGRAFGFSMMGSS
jgi:hypothetical protein